jgi:hypothetical protein
VNGWLSATGRLDRLALTRENGVRPASAPPAWRVEVEPAFDATAAGEYWLAHCEGFLVDTTSGRPVGVVGDVRLDRTTLRAASLQVAGGWFGRRRIVTPVDRVRAVLPLERRLLVDASGADGSGRPDADE